MNNFYEDYIDKTKKNINFYLDCNQWSGINKTTINSWMENFPNDINIRYFAHRLLEQMVYYSETDLKKMLIQGVYNKVIVPEILKIQKENNFNLPQNHLQFYLARELKNTIFVPLLDREAPYESGNQISRILTQQMRIPTSQVLFSSKISGEHESFKRLIIVDDCIGSGDQCRDFWELTEVEGGQLLKDWCSANNVTPYYVVLVGYESNIKKVSKELEGLTICCVELLQDEHRVFSKESYFWKDESEKLEARELFRSLLSEYNIPLYGYNNMDFAVIMHSNIPDWSLPMFWRGTNSWDLLLERKNSYE